jgi:hypothetical protein
MAVKMKPMALHTARFSDGRRSSDKPSAVPDPVAGCVACFPLLTGSLFALLESLQADEHNRSAARTRCDFGDRVTRHRQLP